MDVGVLQVYGKQAVAFRFRFFLPLLCFSTPNRRLLPWQSDLSGALVVDLTRFSGDPILFLKAKSDPQGYVVGDVPSQYDFSKFGDAGAWQVRSPFQQRQVAVQPGAVYYIGVFNYGNDEGWVVAMKKKLKG